MRTLKSLIKVCFLFLAFTISAQNMQDGFTFLETGNYAKAEIFFKNILKDYPYNKTARLCYARAVGLSGDAKQAKLLFKDLLIDHPNDFEVKLNYGESLLWTNNFGAAKSYFEELINEQPDSFPALLSYANTLSNLKEYPGAIDYVNRALEVSPENPNALISKKYIYLGYAYEQQQRQKYTKAEALLKENLMSFENDKETLMNLANLYLIASRLDDAKIIYNLLAEDTANKLIALNGLSLVAHLKGKEKNALAFSTEAFNSLTETTDATIEKQTTERYAQALIWNKNYKVSSSLIDQLIIQHPNKNWVLGLRATLNIYKSNFKESLADYNQILANDSTSFDGNLGKANVLKAIGRYNDSYSAAEKTLTFYTNQKDATNFINQMNSSFTPYVMLKSLYSFDNGNNEAYAIQNTLGFPITTKLKVTANYNYRTTSNKITDQKATTNDLSLGVNYELFPLITFKSIAGLTSVDTTTDKFTNLLTDVSFNIKAMKLQVLDIGFRRQTENFNAALLERQLIQNSFYLNYNLSTNFKFGWYTQYIYTSQSDNNTRNLFFTSLYYNISNDPTFKVGINYQYITFKDQVPTIYFSPERFKVLEVFVDLLKNQNTNLIYNLSGAAGLQFINNNKAQNAFRIKGELGYNISNRFTAGVYGRYSDIASATAAGFNYTELGIQAKWMLTKKPVFR